jgi:hypothetical protein
MNIERISAILIYYYLFIYIISYTIIHLFTLTITFFISLFNIYNIHPILSIYLHYVINDLEYFSSWFRFQQTTNKKKI